MRSFQSDRKVIGPRPAPHLTERATAVIIAARCQPEKLEVYLSNYRFVQLDVFTQEAFAGNPLAVFPEAAGLTDAQMLQIAREMNLSETVFVLKPNKEQSADSNQQSAEPVTEEKNKVQDASRETDGAAGNESPSDASKPKVLRRLRIFTPTREW